jgi:hypothetical protein
LPAVFDVEPVLVRSIIVERKLYAASRWGDVRKIEYRLNVLVASQYGGTYPRGINTPIYIDGDMPFAVNAEWFERTFKTNFAVLTATRRGRGQQSRFIDDDYSADGDSNEDQRTGD